MATSAQGNYCITREIGFHLVNGGIDNAVIVIVDQTIFKWRIPSYFALKNHRTSKRFHCGGYTLSLVLDTFSREDSCNLSLSLNLRCSPDKNITDCWHFPITFALGFGRPSDGAPIFFTSSHSRNYDDRFISNDIAARGFANFVRREDLEYDFARFGYDTRDLFCVLNVHNFINFTNPIHIPRILPNLPSNDDHSERHQRNFTPEHVGEVRSHTEREDSIRESLMVHDENQSHEMPKAKAGKEGSSIQLPSNAINIQHAEPHLKAKKSHRMSKEVLTTSISTTPLKLALASESVIPVAPKLKKGKRKLEEVSSKSAYHTPSKLPAENELEIELSRQLNRCM